MKNFLLLVVALTISACAQMDKKNDANVTIADGVWAGVIKTESIKADSTKQEDSNELLIATCSGIVRFWAGKGDGKYVKLGVHYTIHSLPGSHLIYFIDADPEESGWVEIQSYSLLEINADLAVLQWSRAVNNRDVDDSKSDRYFFSQGNAELHRVSTTCNDKMVP